MPSLHVFVDTNVFLSFFAFASDDIQQLKKLEGLIGAGKLKLYVNQQVADEFARNRETKLAASIRQFDVQGSRGLPRFMSDTDEAKAYSDAVKALDKARNALVQKARADAAANALAVDVLVVGLMKKAGVAPVTSQMVEQARLRRDLGNPPGKATTLGDQINWEYLLETVPGGTPLHVVSKDGDFGSALEGGVPHQFLCEEWRDKKQAELHLHQELKPFLNRHFKTIKLEIDREKDAAIMRLVQSGNFATTHDAIAHLEPYFDALTLEDANKLVEGSVENTQINWIGSDKDVSSFYTRLLDRYRDQLDLTSEAFANIVFRQARPEAPDQAEEAAF